MHSEEDQELAAKQLQIARKLSGLKLYLYLKTGDEEEAHKTIERLSDDGWFEVKGRISPGAPQENVPRYRGPSEFEETCSVHPSVLKAVGGSPLIGDHIMARYSPGDRMIEVQSFNNSHFWLHIELPMGTGV